MKKGSILIDILIVLNIVMIISFITLSTVKQCLKIDETIIKIKNSIDEDLYE